MSKPPNIHFLIWNELDSLEQMEGIPPANKLNIAVDQFIQMVKAGQLDESLAEVRREYE